MILFHRCLLPSKSSCSHLHNEIIICMLLLLPTAYHFVMTFFFWKLSKIKTKSKCALCDYRTFTVEILTILWIRATLIYNVSRHWTKDNFELLTNVNNCPEIGCDLMDKKNIFFYRETYRKSPTSHAYDCGVLLLLMLHRRCMLL